MMLLESDSTRSLLPPSSRLIRYVVRKLVDQGYGSAARMALLADLRRVQSDDWGRPGYRWSSLLTADERYVIDLPDTTSCQYCSNFTWSEQTQYVNGWGDVCQECLDADLHTCQQCDREFMASEPMYYDGAHICDYCWNNATRCSQCYEMYFGSGAEDDGWYYSQSSRSWYCAGCAPACRNGQCEAGGQVFSIPAYGATIDDRLSNDTALTVEVAGGEIPVTATKAVQEMLVNRCRLYLNEYSADWNTTIGDRWQTKEGNWPKRFAAYLLKNHNLKLAEPLLAEIGNMVRQEASRTTECIIDVTRDFNQTAHRFCHSGSCYWGQYIKSRCALKSNGSFALRMWGSTEMQKDLQYGASGRVWVQPVTWDGSGRDLMPTTDTDAKIYVLWNFYYSDSSLPRLLLARILAQLIGKTYWQTTIELPEHVYNNTGNNVIVAAPDVIDAMQQSRYSNDWTLQMEEAH